MPKGGHICTRLGIEGKCALPMEDNIADMKIPNVIIFKLLV